MKQTEIEQKQMLDLLNAQIESALELVKLANRIKQIANGITPKTVLTDEDEEGWYIDENGWIGLHKKGQKEHVAVFNGIFYTSCWTWLYNGTSGPIRKATPEEIQTRLTKVAEGMGFKEGVTINKSGINALFSIKFNPISGKFIYYESRDILGSEGGNGYVYHSGQWATIVSQPKPHEMTKGKWYIGNEPDFGDWLFQFQNFTNNSGQVKQFKSYSLCDMILYNDGLNTYTSTRDLTPEEEAKYAHLMQEKVTVGGHEVRINEHGHLGIAQYFYTREHLINANNLVRLGGITITLHGETMTTDKLQKLIDLIDGK